MSSDALIGRGFTAPRHRRFSSKEHSDRPTAAALRKISRLIKLIPNTDDVVSILTTCMQGNLLVKETESYGSTSLSSFFEMELNPLRTKKLNRYCSGWIKNAEARLVDAMQVALSKYRTSLQTHKSRVCAASSGTSLSRNDLSSPITPSFRTPDQPSVLENIAIISDDSEGILEEETVTLKANSSAFTSTDDACGWNQFWFLFLEHLHFSITSKLIRGTGMRVKSYDVYRLSRPARALSSRATPEDIRLKVLQELLWIYSGTSVDCVKNSLHQKSSECRVYVSLQKQSTIWLQIYIGPVGETKQMNVKEFIMVVPSESPFVAMATNRMSAKNRFISYVLSAVEAALSEHKIATDPDSEPTHDLDCLPRRMDQFSGLDPYELLSSVQEFEHRRNVGGHKTNPSDFEQGIACSMNSPASDLHASATGSLYDPSDKKFLHSGTECELEVSAIPTILLKSDAVPSFKHATSERLRSRKRSLQECPLPKVASDIRKCVRWDWTGLTNASSSCYAQSLLSSPGAKANKPHKFKCRVTMQGENVLQGMKALEAGGFMKQDAAAIPHYVKNVNAIIASHILGDNDVICVENGDVILSKSPSTDGETKL